MTKIKIGDVIEIPTPNGFSYAQFTHYHSQPPRYGALIRVLDGFYRNRPKDVSELVNRPTKFVTFFPLQAAINKTIVSVIGNERIPTTNQMFPLFRAGMVNPQTGTVENWWLWDGDKEWEVGQLNDEQTYLPIREVINDTRLIERIISGWTPRKDFPS